MSVYVIRNSATSWLKIGKSEDPLKRMAGFQRKVPDDALSLVVVFDGAGFALERMVDARFDGDGAADWFRDEGLSPGTLRLPSSERPSAAA